MRDKYHYDGIVRTRVRTIALQVIFVVGILGIFLMILQAIQYQITNIVISGISDSVNAGGRVTQETLEIPAAVDAAKWRILAAAFIIITTITVIFGYFISRIILSPTRDLLESQKQFIGNIAHELRTPLSIIKTNTEVALLDERADDELRRTLRSNVEEIDRASQIINNLLTLNALIQPEGINFENVDLGDIVDTTVRKLRDLARGKQVEIEFSKSDFRIVWGNGIALEQVVLNTLKNAVMYTRPQGRVWIRIEPDYRNSIRLTIRDTGIGISQKDLFHIFEPFYRAERSRRRDGSGSGLGLTIVSELVKIHGGQISIQSALGKGTTVLVLLPCGTPPENEVVDEDAPNKISMNFSKRSIKQP